MASDGGTMLVGKQIIQIAQDRHGDFAQTLFDRREVEILRLIFDLHDEQGHGGQERISQRYFDMRPLPGREPVKEACRCGDGRVYSTIGRCHRYGREGWLTAEDRSEGV